MKSYRCLIPLFSALLLTVSPVRAVDYCVGSAAELEAAMSQAIFASSEDDNILVERGLYLLPDGLSYYQNHWPGPPLPTGWSGGLAIRGGYDVGCGGRIPDPHNTVLSGQGDPDSAMRFNIDGDDLELDGLMFQSVARVEVIDDYCAYGEEDGIVLRRLRIQAATSPTTASLGGALILFITCQPTRIENVLIADSARDGLFVSAAGQRVDIVNTTIIDSGNHGLEWLVDGSEGSALNLTNSILWGSADLDIAAGSLSVLPANNTHYGTLAPGLSLFGEDNVQGDPLLDSSHRPSEPGSPVIDEGTTVVPGGLPYTDLVGELRAIGGIPDRGAYESGVNQAGASILVSNTLDTGSGSLRAAITTANASAGRQRIVFNLPGACPQTIVVNSPLPVITQGLEIDGYTQSGATLNTTPFGFDAALCVILQASTSSPASLQVGFDILTTGASSNDSVLIRGLAFSNWVDDFGAAIRIRSGRGHRIEGNQFGASVGSVALLPNDDQIRIDGTTPNQVNGVVVGGRDPAQVNLISGAIDDGVELRGEATAVRVTGNRIGVAKSGNSALPNNVGVHIFQAPGNTVEYNLISGNSSHAVWVHGAQSDYNTVLRNRIGVRALSFCLPPCIPSTQLPNGGHGVLIERDGVDSPLANPANTDVIENHIANSGGDGVWVRAGSRHRIAGTFVDNTGLPIDLGLDGPDAIDDDNATLAITLPNRGLNAPQLISALGADHTGQVAGQLQSTAGDYTITLFVNDSCPPDGRGEAQDMIARHDIELVGTGLVTAPWTATVYGTDLIGRYVTAHVRDNLGNTSEFSICASYEASQLFSNGFESP